MSLLQQSHLLFLTSVSFFFFSCKEKSPQLEDGFWHDINNAYQISKETQKPIFVDVWAEWCHPCKIMDKEIYQQTEYKNLINEKFIPVRLDLDQEEKILCANQEDTPYRCLDLHWQLRGVPLGLILNAKGEVLNYRLGQIGPDEFKLFLAEPLLTP